MLFASYWIYSLMLGLIVYGVALSLDLIAGRLGLFLLAQGAFMGVGGYTAALAMLHLGFGTVPALALGAVATTLVAFLAALPALRVRDEYLIVVGLGLQIVASEVFSNLHILGGVDGLPGIPTPFNSSSEWVFLGGAVAVVGIVLVVYLLLTTGQIGRTIAMIREDDIAAETLGRNVVAIKVGVVAISGGLAGLCGAYYVTMNQYAAPSDFDISQTVLFLTIVFVGGMRSPVGIALGTVALVGIQQYLAQVSSGPAASTLEQVGFGVLLVVIVLVAPHGLGGGLKWLQQRITKQLRPRRARKAKELGIDSRYE